MSLSNIIKMKTDPDGSGIYRVIVTFEDRRGVETEYLFTEDDAHAVWNGEDPANYEGEKIA
jgi:hypothetical protein